MGGLSSPLGSGNPILDEIMAAHSSLSPAAQKAVGMAGAGMAGTSAASVPLAKPMGGQPLLGGVHGQPLEPGPVSLPSGPMPSMPSSGGLKVNAPLGTVEGDQAKRSGLMGSTPGLESVYGKIAHSGFGQEHPLAGKILGGLAQVPATAADIGLTQIPSVGAMVPGTSLNHAMQVRGAGKALTEDEGNREKEAQTASLNAEVPLRNAQTKGAEATAAAQPALSEAEIAEHNAHAASLMHPEAKTAFEEWQRQNPGKPVEEWLRESQKAQKPDTPEQQFIDEFTKSHPNGTIADAVHAYATATQKPERGPTVIQQGAELDRAGARFGKPYEAGNTAASAQLEKIAEAKAMINGSAAAQAVGIPKILTALVSGAGSGVRITQAELNMIAHARGIQGDFEGFVNKLSGKGVLSADQQKQFSQILDDVASRIRQKQQITNDTLDRINGAGTRDEIVLADKEARQKLTQLEKFGHYEGETVTIKGKQVTINKIHPDGSFE